MEKASIYCGISADPSTCCGELAEWTHGPFPRHDWSSKVIAHRSDLENPAGLQCDCRRPFGCFHVGHGMRVKVDVAGAVGVRAEQAHSDAVRDGCCLENLPFSDFARMLLHTRLRAFGDVPAGKRVEATVGVGVVRGCAAHLLPVCSILIK